MESPKVEYLYNTVDELILDTNLSRKITADEMTSLYDDISLNYDQLFGPHAEMKTTVLMNHLLVRVPDRSARILDVAAGTGFVAVKLHTLGYMNVDALDPSAKMLDKAKEKNIYLNYYEDYVVADKQTSVPENTYDATLVCGGFQRNQMDESALVELIRVTKPGGFIIFYMPTSCATEAEKEMARLHKERSCLWHLKQFEPNFKIGGDEYTYVLQKV